MPVAVETENLMQPSPRARRRLVDQTQHVKWGFDVVKKKRGGKREKKNLACLGAGPVGAVFLLLFRHYGLLIFPRGIASDCKKNSLPA